MANKEQLAVQQLRHPNLHPSTLVPKRQLPMWEDLALGSEFQCGPVLAVPGIQKVNYWVQVASALLSLELHK